MIAGLGARSPRPSQRSVVGLTRTRRSRSASVLTAPAPEAPWDQRPSNPAPIVINQSSSPGNQSVDPYPSNLTTYGIDGPITDVNVDLNNLTFGVPARRGDPAGLTDRHGRPALSDSCLDHR